MVEKPNTALLERLEEIRENIQRHMDTLLEGLKPFLTEEKRPHVQDNLIDIKRISQSSELLKKEAGKLLENEAIEKNIFSNTVAEYLSKVRHDLRNPVNSILGFAEIVLEDFQEKNQSEGVAPFQEIISLTKQTLRLINDIKILEPQPASIIESPVESFEVEKYPSTPIEKNSEDAEFQYFKENFAILIVDDNDANCQLLDKYLKLIGYKNTHIVHDGFQALAIKNRFDLVLLDISMPGMSGIQVLQRLKEAILQRQIMVLMISAADNVENAIECIQLGAEDFLPKPFDKDLLRVRIGSCIEKKWSTHKESIYKEHLQFERERYEKLLHALFPPVIVQELTETGKIQACYYNNVAIIFADVVGFTPYCDTHELADTIKNLQKLAEFGEVESNRNNVQKIKTIGDCFLGVSGLLTKSNNPVLDCVNFANNLIVSCAKLPSKWQLHIGIHYGNLIGGIVGHRQYLFDVWGDAVNTASRIQSLSEPNKIYLSKAAWDLIKDTCVGHSLGEMIIKGKTPLEVFVYEDKA